MDHRVIQQHKKIIFFKAFRLMFLWARHLNFIVYCSLTYRLLCFMCACLLVFYAWKMNIFAISVFVSDDSCFNDFMWFLMKILFCNIVLLTNGYSTPKIKKPFLIQTSVNIKTKLNTEIHKKKNNGIWNIRKNSWCNNRSKNLKAIIIP